MIDVFDEDGVDDFGLDVLAADVGALDVFYDFEKSKSSSTKCLVTNLAVEVL